MADYLLDTNIVQYWYDAACPEHPRVLARVNDVRRPDPQTGYVSRLYISIITRAEIEYGHRVVAQPDAAAQTAYLKFINEELHELLDISKHTIEPYAEVRAWLFEHCSPKTKRGKAKRPEELVHPTAARELGIDENDLWIAAQAATHNLVLVTHDGLANLKSALQAVTPTLVLEDWAAE